jgi:hypothetical protein
MTTTIKAPKLLDKKYGEWLTMFEKVSALNDWQDQEKLMRAIMSLNKTTRTWALRSSFSNWSAFVSEFKKKYVKKETIFEYASKLMTLKQRTDEGNKKFVRRLEKLWSLYSELAMANGEKTAAFELVLIKSLSKGIRSKSLRRALRVQNYTSVETFIQGFKDLDDIDSSSDDDSDSDTGSMDSDSSNSSAGSSSSISSVKAIKKSKSSAPKQSDDVATLTQSIKEMTVALLAQQEKIDALMAKPVSQSAAAGNARNLFCYNCKEKGHRSAECDKPCRYCQQNHPHFTCSQHVPKSRPYSTPMDAKLCQISQNVTQDAMAVTRKAQDMETETTPIATKKRKVTLKNKSTSRSLTQWPLSAQHLINQPVYQVSLAQLADLNTSLRTSIKDGLTRHHQPKEKAFKATLENQATLPVGNSVPHTLGKVAGHDCPMILDGGCTPCIISKKLVLYLGITELDATDTKLMVANGDSVSPLGILKNVSISVGPSKTIEVDAVCLDIADYDFLVGRVAFHAFGLDTNWKEHTWMVSNEQGKLESMEVSYTHSQLTGNFPIPDGEQVDSSDDEDQSDSDVASSYLVAFAGAVDENESEITTSFDPRLGNLPQRIMNNQVIKELNIQDHVMECIENNIDCFGTDYQHLKQTDITELHIETGDHAPIYRRPYGNLSHQEKEFLRKELTAMVENGIIVPTTYLPSNSKSAGWSFPCRLIQKKTGDKRLVTNFMELNKITTRDTWPLPIMTDLLEQLGGSNFFTSMDLLKGFHQIKVNDASINKLTISTPFGNYSYVVMPFGVSNGPSTFCRAINMALGNLLNSSVVAYIDDIIVHSPSHHQHLLDLENFFIHIKNANMVLNANKCSFFEKSVSFVGFIADAGGYRPDPARVQAISNFPRPLCTRDVRAFLGVIGFYRRHIHLFADITAPLTALLKKDAAFIWTPELENCFVKSRQLLEQNCLLAYPDHTKTYYLFTDSSDFAIGGALCLMVDGDYVPVAFISRKLQAAEFRYPTVEKELIAVVYSFKMFRKFLLDKTFYLFTDNSAVVYLFAKQDSSQRLQRWTMCCLEYSFIVKHLPGKQNVVADALSRFPPAATPETDGLDDIEHLYHGLLTMESMYEDEMQSIYQFLLQPWKNESTKRIQQQARHYRIQNQKLFKQLGNRSVMVPYLQERQGILSMIHDGHGHFGIQATWSSLYLHYWWPTAYVDTVKYLQSCHQCQIFNSQRQKHTPLNQVIGAALFEQFSIDYIGPFPASKKGNKYIILAVENFSRWPIAIATPKNDAFTTANFLYNHIMCNFGPPTHLLSDNGVHFLNNVVEQLLLIIKTNHKVTSIYHPQTNGMAERINGVIVKTLKKLVDQNQAQWDDLLPAALYSYRIKSHTALKISPYEAIYGQPPSLACQDVLYSVGKSMGFERLVKLWGIRAVMETDAGILKEKNDAQGFSSLYEIGDQVLMIDHRRDGKGKLAPVYLPKVYHVVECYKDSYRIMDEQGVVFKHRVNGKSLRKYYHRTENDGIISSVGVGNVS